MKILAALAALACLSFIGTGFLSEASGQRDTYYIPSDELLDIRLGVWAETLGGGTGPVVVGSLVPMMLVEGPLGITYIEGTEDYPNLLVLGIQGPLTITVGAVSGRGTYLLNVQKSSLSVY